MNKMKRQSTKQQPNFKHKPYHNSDEDGIPMTRKVVPLHQRQTIEAQVLENDTLQAISIRFHCTVAELKRLNKIDKENEIFARKVILVPQTIHNILLPADDPQSLPPSSKATSTNKEIDNQEPKPSTSQNDQTVNEIILNTKLKSNRFTDTAAISEDETAELVQNSSTTYVDSHPVVLRQKNDFLNFSGSDCDISWICLVVGILALCVAIPLILIIVIT